MSPSLPWVSASPELNVRTYVRVADKPGVYFFSLDAGNPLAVAAARALFHLPYYYTPVAVKEAYIVIPDTRHFMTVEKPEAVNAALTAFLERHRNRAETAGR